MERLEFFGQFARIGLVAKHVFDVITAFSYDHGDFPLLCRHHAAGSEIYSKESLRGHGERIRKLIYIIYSRNLMPYLFSIVMRYPDVFVPP
jgi:hypothetical protein